MNKHCFAGLLMTAVLFLAPVYCSATASANTFKTQAEASHRRHSNYITMYAIRPAVRIKWETAKSVLLSYARNIAIKKLTGRRHSMGHLSFEVACTQGGDTNRVLSGQAEESMDGFVSSLKEGAGFSVFFKSVEGRLERAEDLESEYSKLTAVDNRMAITTFVLSETSCKKAMSFFNEYKDTGAYKKYGLTLDPSLKEGGGCASLGAHILKSAIPAKEYDVQAVNWQQKIKIPLSGFGTEDKKVKMGKLIFKKYSFDLDNTDAGIPVSFYDPHLVYDWSKKIFMSGNKRLVGKYYFNKTPSIVLDYTDL